MSRGDDQTRGWQADRAARRRRVRASASLYAGRLGKDEMVVVSMGGVTGANLCSAPPCDLKPTPAAAWRYFPLLSLFSRRWGSHGHSLLIPVTKGAGE